MQEAMPRPKRASRSPLGMYECHPAPAAEDLHVEVYTPSHFEASCAEAGPSRVRYDEDEYVAMDVDEEEEEDEYTSDIGDDYDMYEDDEDVYLSDEDDDENPHEAMVEVDIYPQADAYVALPPAAPVFPPPLPGLAGIKVWYLRSYPEPPRAGTPRRVDPWHRGLLSRESLSMAAELTRVTGLPQQTKLW